MFQKIILLAAAAAFLLGPASAQDKVGTVAAPFLNIGVGARATAMGGAQVAFAEGPSALYWNPSAVTAMQSSGVEFSHADWFIDSRFEYLAVVLNAGNMGHIGFSLLSMNYGEIEVTSVDRPEGTGEQFVPQDLSVGVSYARALTDRFSIGGTAKFINQSIWNESASGAALDLGVTYLTGFRNLRIGMSLANFGTTMKMDGKDLRRAIDIDQNNNGNNPYLPAYLEVDEWALPLMFRVGIAMNAFETSNQRFSVSADAVAPSDNAQSANLGAEYAFRDLFFLRGGYRQAFSSISDDAGWSVGGGLRYSVNDRMAGYFDYTFRQHNRLGNPQIFSAGFTF